jgi:alanine racemase
MQRSGILNKETGGQENMIIMMENSGSGAATEDRIAALEKKMRDMEALLKGLTGELLDLKSIAMKMSKQTDERIKQDLRRPGIVVQGSQPSADVASPSSAGSTVVMRKGARQPDVPAAPAEPAMDMIMQQDGTMKLEPRRGDKDYIVARAGYGQKKGAAGKPKQADLIYAAEESKDPAKK